MKENNQQVVVDQTLETLRELITLPATPAEVWFEQLARGTPGGLGPTDYVLIVVMRFNPTELARIKAQAQRRPGSPPRLASDVNRPWFPEPVSPRFVRPATTA
jgi:hypothetical protein